MNRATPQMRIFARRLMTHEMGENESPATETPAGFIVCEKLRLHLATFIGNTGFRTLLSRSLALSAKEVPWLRTVRVNADGPLEGLAELETQLDRDECFEGGEV